MKFINIILISFILASTACTKKNKPPGEESSAPAPADNAGISCQELPPTPKPFGWYDTLIDKNKTINAFLFDPLNSDRIIYVVNGDESGFNRLYFYNIPSKKSKYVCTLGEYLPEINKKGWITFSDVDHNVFLIKNNTDSLITLMINKHCHNPKWDYTGTKIYYFSEAYGSYTSQLLRADTAGLVEASYEMDLPYCATFKKTNKMLLLDYKNNLCTLKLRDLLNPGNDKLLLTGSLYTKANQINFNNLALDNTDENFFWSNSNGIFRCNLNSLKIDTLTKNCPNLIFRNPMVSFTNNELTYTHEILIPLNSLRLFHDFKTMEMNLNTLQSTEIKIFP